MKAIPEIKLEELVAEQEQAAWKAKRERIAKLVGEKIHQRERIKEQIIHLQDELEDVTATIAYLRKEDWTQIDWKPDSSEA